MADDGSKGWIDTARSALPADDPLVQGYDKVSGVIDRFKAATPDFGVSEAIGGIMAPIESMNDKIRTKVANTLSNRFKPPLEHATGQDVASAFIERMHTSPDGYVYPAGQMLSDPERNPMLPIYGAAVEEGLDVQNLVPQAKISAAIKKVVPKSGRLLAGAVDDVPGKKSSLTKSLAPEQANFGTLEVIDDPAPKYGRVSVKETRPLDQLQMDTDLAFKGVMDDPGLAQIAPDSRRKLIDLAATGNPQATEIIKKYTQSSVGKLQNAAKDQKTLKRILGSK